MLPQREMYLVKHESQSIESPGSSYTPNLQFRKIWDENNNNTNSATRPRNASYFDPLASPGAGNGGPANPGGSHSFNIPRNSSVNSSYSTDSKQSYLPPPPPPPPLSTVTNRSTSMISPSSPDPSQNLPMPVPQMLHIQQPAPVVAPAPRSIPNDYVPAGSSSTGAAKKHSVYSQTRPSLSTEFPNKGHLPSIGSIASITSQTSSIFSNKSSFSSVSSLPAPPPQPVSTQTNSSLNKILTPTPTTRPPSTPLPQENYSPTLPPPTNNNIPGYPRIRSLSPQSMLTKHMVNSPKVQEVPVGVPEQAQQAQQPQPHRALTSSPLSKEKNSKVSVNSLLD
ncbi:hypothetical protein JA1_002282 [Spathaspora sp. JA1]|nr:hypothetical protein JA1_002282 [Spathaspora sp. JA1]